MISQLNAILSYNNSITKNLELKDLIHLFKTDYSLSFDYYADNITFSRTDNFDYPFILYKPGERTSIIGNNHLFYLTLILPSWHNFPKRNHSIFIKNNDEVFIRFGKCNKYVFPKNNALLAISNGCDFNYNTYKNSGKYISTIAEHLINAIGFFCNFRFFNYEHSENIDDYYVWINTCDSNLNNNNINTKFSLEKLNNLDYVENLFNNLKIFNEYFYIKAIYSLLIFNIKLSDIVDNLKKYGTLETLDKYINPDNCNRSLSIKSLNNYKNEYKYDSEIWTESPCIIIKQNVFKNIYDELCESLNYNH